MKTQNWIRITAATFLLLSTAGWAAEDALLAPANAIVDTETSSRSLASIRESERNADDVDYQVNADNSEPLVVIYSAQTYIIRE